MRGIYNDRRCGAMRLVAGEVVGRRHVLGRDAEVGAGDGLHGGVVAAAGGQGADGERGDEGDKSDADDSEHGDLQALGSPRLGASPVPLRRCAESLVTTGPRSDIRVLTGCHGPASVVAMSTKKPVILIADDDPEILTMLGIRLSKKGYQVLEAVDGAQTMNLARKHHPDLVLLDVMMPGKNGWEVARELRSDDQFSNLGIVMLTAIGEKVNEMTSPLYGADAYVDKPFDFADLETKIKDVLAERQKLS
jgi:CheY-like chemotaxis protein